MTKGVLESLVDAIGEEISKCLVGFRSTRIDSVATEGDTSFTVESTLDWESAGFVYVDQVRYQYTGKTLTTLTGVAYWDGVSYVSGAKQQHLAGAEVLDYTRNFSSADIYRRGWFIDTAEGSDLNFVGQRLGLLRGNTQEDAEYRALLKAVAIANKGTVKSLEDALDVLVGPSDYVILHDGTGTSGQHNAARVYLARTDILATVSEGQDYIDFQRRVRPSVNTGSNLGAVSVNGIKSARFQESSQDRLVQGPISASFNGTTVINSATSLSTTIQPGDYMLILEGPAAGTRISIAAYVSTSVLTASLAFGSPYYSYASGIFRTKAEIRRPWSNFRHYKPSSDSVVTESYLSTLPQWTFNAGGGATEGSDVIVVTGDYLNLDIDSGETGTYTHSIPVESTSNVTYEIQIDANRATDTQATDEALQNTFWIADGSKLLRVGLSANGADRTVGFVNTSGAYLTAGAGETTTATITADWHNFRLAKMGTGDVKLFVDGVETLVALNASFSSSTATQLGFGCLSTAADPMDMRIRTVRWTVDGERDYANVFLTNGTTSATATLNGSSFSSGNVGKYVHLRGATAKNAGGGNTNGIWVVNTFTSSSVISLKGASKPYGRFVNSVYPRRFYLTGLDAYPWFKWPDTLGHTLVIETGVNAGSYTIAKILNPATKTDIALKYPLSVAATSVQGPSESSTMIEVATDFPDPTDTEECTWRVDPVFVSDSGPLTVHVSDVSSSTAGNITYAQTLPITPSGGFPDIVYLYGGVESGYSERSDIAAEDTHAFYIPDVWGYKRALLQKLIDAGIQLDFDSLYSDSTGLHVQED